MGKEISNPIVVEFRFIREGTTWTVMSYVTHGVTIAEYPEIGDKRKSISLVLTPSETTQIINFAKTVVAPQLNTKLPITP